MLVAIASKVNSLNENLSESSSASSSSDKLSLIIFEPISKSKINAIHGANVVMSHSNWIPPNQPRIGINDWNPPKNIANHKTWLLVIFFKVNPFVSETLNASIASAIAINKVDKKSIVIS